MTEDEMNELLAAYALDAVDDSERREIDTYLTRNAKARSEVAEHREVATMLASTGAPAPSGLWDKIAASLDERAPAPGSLLAPLMQLDSQRDKRNRRTKRSPWLLFGAVAVAACAAVGVLGIKLHNRTDELNNARSQSASAQLVTAASAAMATSSRKVTMTAESGATAASVAIDGSEGYFVADQLPALSADRTYQLWGLIDNKVISLGVLGNSPKVVVFPADSRLTTLMLTNETAGGVSVSTQKPIVVGTLPQ